MALVNTHLLRCEHSLILWLVPSKAIREQALKALKDRNHPYHVALRGAGPVPVMDLEEAKSVTRATLDTSTTVIVATRQAFQVEKECRKVVEGRPGPILAVEYKGADRRDAAEDDRLIGGLWAGLSEGRCRFVMVKDRRWDWIEPILQ